MSSWSERNFELALMEGWVGGFTFVISRVFTRMLVVMYFDACVSRDLGRRVNQAFRLRGSAEFVSNF